MFAQVEGTRDPKIPLSLLRSIFSCMHPLSHSVGCASVCDVAFPKQTLQQDTTTSNTEEAGQEGYRMRRTSTFCDGSAQ